MTDVPTVAAGAVAVISALSSAWSAAKNPGDLATLRAEIKAARETVAPVVAAMIAEVRALIDPDLRPHLDALLVRVTELEEWRRKRREGMGMGSGIRPPLTSTHDANATERRLEMLEQRATRSEERADKIDASVTTIRESVAGIAGDIRGILRGK